MFVFWPNLMVKAACNKIYPKASSLLLILRYLRFFTMSLSSAAADVIFGCAIMADTTDIPVSYTHLVSTLRPHDWGGGG